MFVQLKDQGSAQRRVVVTFDRVPLWGMADETNTFQIVLHLAGGDAQGQVQLWYGQVSGIYRPLVGISPGVGGGGGGGGEGGGGGAAEEGSGFIESNLVPDLGTCSGAALAAVPPPPGVVESFSRGGGGGGGLGGLFGGLMRTFGGLFGASSFGSF